MERSTTTRHLSPAASPDPGAAARRAASGFVDELVRRARHLTPLVEFLRAHLEATAAGAAATEAEHLVDLLTLGLRWRAHARSGLRRVTARPDHGAVTALLGRLRAAGRPPGEVARLAAWNEFALAECCPEALDEACELAAWFEEAAEARLGRSAPGLEVQLELVRAEVLSRALRGRRAAAPVARLRLHARPIAVPRPGPAQASRFA